MNPTSSPAGTLAKCLAMTLLLSPLPLAAQTTTNPGFEANTFPTFPGYISGAGNGPITGWTGAPADRVGLNPSGGTPFANNGTIPEGTKVAFLQATGAAIPSLQTTVSGLTIGTKYNVSLRVNARYHATANLPFLVFSTDGTGPTVATEVSRASTVVDATPYRTAAYEFTATATSHVITLANTKPTVAPSSTANGDHTLLLDDVTVVPSTGAWSFSAWTGDADSGIDSSHVYTHAFNLGSTANVTINGVPFFGRQSTLPGLFTWTGLTGNTSFSANSVPLHVTGDSATMANTFRHGGVTSITLDNLKPSTAYVFTLYGAGWDLPTSTTPHRASTFSSSLGGDKLTANLAHYGQGQGMKVSYGYTTDALGSPVTISYPALSANQSFHTSGFSNREAVAGTPDASWSIHAWNDDESSGVSPNHVYTHAQLYNNASGQNINGVNFTGIAGGNPSGTNCAVTGMPSTYTNDPNAVTGYGATMAKNFIFDGAAGTFNLSGLTPGKQYLFTLYSVGWDDGTRDAALYGGLGESPTVLGQHTYGDNQGLRFECLYTADASGAAKIRIHGITDIGGVRSIHTYGSSNREADAMVGVAPAITLQPVGAAIGIGSDYTLRAAATGSATLTYQWKRGTVIVPNGDGPELLLEDVDAEDAGSYTLVVSNGVNSATSNAAVVSVLENVPGVFDTGVNDFGGALAAGATDPHYTLVVNPDDPESTTVLVQNPIPGSWVPHSSTSTWVGPRANTAFAMGLGADDGEGLGTYVYRTQVDLTGFDVATVQISGSWAIDNLGMAIRVNGAPTGITHTTGTPFATLVPFTINSTNAPGLVAGINTIDFVVNNADGAAANNQGYTGLRLVDFRAIGVIPPNTPPHIALQPQGGIGPHDGSFTLKVGASGSTPLTYQWYNGEALIPGEESATLSVPIESLTDGGNFKVRVTNGSGFAESNVATVTVTNANPVVVDDDLSTNENVALEITPISDMLDNDTDADGDDLTLAGFSATSFNGGTVTEDNGVLTYTPPPGFDGLDGFTYTISDGWGGTSAAGTVLITVNNVANPAPGPLTLAVNLSGSTVTGTFTGVAGTSYTLQRSTTLETGSWIDVDTEVAPGSGVVTVVDSDPPDGRAFYRISYTP